MIRLPPHVETVIALLRWKQSDDRSVGDRLEDVDWESALAFANAELVTPELHAAVEFAGCGHRLPPDVAAYLAYLHGLNRCRNERMREQLIEVIKAWNDAGLVPLMLKGSVALFTKCETMSFRMMADLDLLFDPAEVEGAIRTAETLGYLRAVDYPTGRHDYACMVRSEEPASLDLHVGLVYPPHLLPAEVVRRRAIPLQRDGVRAMAPSPPDQFQHMVLHDMVHHGSHRSGNIQLRGLTDFARMVKANPTLDWAAILSDLKRLGADNILRAQAFAARELLGVEVPSAAAGGPAARLYYWRGLARWRRQPVEEEPPLLHLILSGLAYRWDPAARMVPFSVKLLRRLLYGWEPTPVEPFTLTSIARGSRSRRSGLAKPAAGQD